MNTKRITNPVIHNAPTAEPLRCRLIPALLAVCVGAAAASLSPAHAREEVHVSNLTSKADSFSEVFFSETPAVAQSFFSDQSFFLSSVYLAIQNFSDEFGQTIGSGGFTVGLYDDNGGLPGLQLQSFLGESNPFATGIYQYKLPSPYTITPNQTYWVGARLTSEDGLYYWDFVQSATTQGPGRLGNSFADGGVYPDRQVIAIMSAEPTPTPPPGVWRGGGASDRWTDSNWVGGRTPANDGTSDIRLGAGARTTTPLVDAAWNVKSVQVSSGTTYNLRGEALTIQNGISVEPGARLSVENSLILPSQYWTVSEGGVLDVTGPISGSVLVKTGRGDLFLSGNNTGLANRLEVNEGKVIFNTPQAWGGSTNFFVGINGGTLQIGRSMTVTNPLDVEGGTILIESGKSLTLNGGVTGRGVLTKDGGGTLTLNGFNSVRGIEARGGTLELNDGNSFSSVLISGASVHAANENSLGGGAVTIDSGSLFARSSFTTLQPLQVLGSAGISVLSGNTLNWGGKLSGNGSIHLSGGTFVYSGNNFQDFTGGFSVSGTFAPGAAMLAAGPSVTLSGGTLRMASSFGMGTLSGSGSLEMQGDQSFLGSMSGTITKTGAGNLTMAGSGFSGTSSFNIAQGSVLISSNASLRNLSQIQIGSNGTLDLNGRSISVTSFNGASGGRLILGGGSLAVGGGVFDGRLTGQGSLRLRPGSSGFDSGFLSLGGDNLGASVGITVESGTALSFRSLNALPGGGAIVGQFGSYVEIAGDLTQAFLERFDKSGTSGTLGFTGNGTGRLDFTGFDPAMRLTGNRIVSGAEIVPVGNVYRFGAGAAISGSSVLTIAADLTGNRSVNVANGAVRLEGNNSFTEGVVAESGGRILFMNSGSLPTQGFFSALDGGYVGLGFDSGNPQLFIDRLDKTATTGTIGFDAPSVKGTIDLTGFSESVKIGTSSFSDFAAEIIPQGNFYRFGGGSGILRVSTVLSGNRGVVVSPGATVELAAVNTYTAGTTVSGSLHVAGDSGLGSSGGSITLLQSGSLLFTETAVTVRDILLSNFGSSAIGVSPAKMLSLRGSISGDGGLDVYGGGLVIMDTAASYSGSTSVSGGILRNGKDNALPTTTSLQIQGGRYELAGSRQTLKGINSPEFLGSRSVMDLGGGELTLASESGGTFSEFFGVVTGGGRLNVGAGTNLGLYGSNIHTGEVSINGGTLTIRSTASLGADTATVGLRGGTLVYDPTIAANPEKIAQSLSIEAPRSRIDVERGTLAIGGDVRGSGGIDKRGAGILEVRDVPDFSGEIRVSAGSLSVAGVAPLLGVDVTSGTRLIGSGRVQDVTFGTASVLSPGVFGTLGTITSQTAQFQGGVRYEWDIRSAIGDRNDLFSATGGIDLVGTESNPIRIAVATERFVNELEETYAPLADFDNRELYEWTLIETPTVTGFHPNLFALDLSGFGSTVNPDAFYIARGVKGVALRYDIGRISRAESVATQAVKAGQPISGSVSLSEGLRTEATIAGSALPVSGFVSLTISERDGFESQSLASDVLTLEGTNGVPIVLQLSYDEATAIALFGSEDAVRLGWLDTFDGSWKLAVVGNSGTVDFDKFYAMSYEEFLTNQGGSFDGVTMLGAYGVDVDQNVAWAVIDHNSDFAVLNVVPEPSTWVLIALALAFFGRLAFKMRRSNR